MSSDRNAAAPAAASRVGRQATCQAPRRAPPACVRAAVVAGDRRRLRFHTSRPAVAASDSWKPTSPMADGSATSIGHSCQGQCPTRLCRASTLARADDHRRHDRCAEDGRFAAGQQRIAPDQRQDGERTPPPAEPPEHRPGNGGQQRQVRAADSDNVAQPGGAEVTRYVACQLIAQADEQARCQPGLRLRHGARQQVGGGSSGPLEFGERRVSCAQQIERARPD